MSAMIEAVQAIHAGSLADLPTDRVQALYNYGQHMWARSVIGSDDELYYARMINLTSKELQGRS